MKLLFISQECSKHVSFENSFIKNKTESPLLLTYPACTANLQYSRCKVPSYTLLSWLGSILLVREAKWDHCLAVGDFSKIPLWICHSDRQTNLHCPCYPTSWQCHNPGSACWQTGTSTACWQVVEQTASWIRFLKCLNKYHGC